MAQRYAAMALKRIMKRAHSCLRRGLKRGNRGRETATKVRNNYTSSTCSSSRVNTTRDADKTHTLHNEIKVEKTGAMLTQFDADKIETRIIGYRCLEIEKLHLYTERSRKKLFV